MSPRLSQTPAARLVPGPRLAQCIALACMPLAAIDDWLREAERRLPGLVLHRPLLGPPPPVDHPLAMDQAEAGAREGSLLAHVLEQAGLCGLAEDDWPIALAFIEAIEPWGWLGAQPAAIAEGLGESPARCESVLAKLQRMEPTGLFARDLSDCLRLQMVEQGILDADASKVLTALDAFALGGAEALAERSGLTPAQVARVLGRLRRLDPKPGLVFQPPPAQAVIPDAQIVRIDGEWRFQPRRLSQPRIRPAAGASAGVRGEVRRIQRALDYRLDAILKVGRFATARQQAWLAGHSPAPAALTQSEAARQTGLSRATVSRVVNAAFVITTKGTCPLKAFFPPRPAVSSGGVARPVVIDRLRQLLGDEDGAAPLTDAALVRCLGREGIAISRRTIAKYRLQLGVAAARRRPA